MAKFEETWKIPHTMALLAGLLSPLATTNISHLIGLWEMDWLFIFAIVPYLLSGILIFKVAGKLSLPPFVIIYLAIPFGVIIDVLLDSVLWNIDRNLFPVEIGAHLLVAWAPLLVGGLIGHSASSNK